MLTTSPYLRIRRPSPTAAEFIVSTQPPLTIGLRIVLYTVHLLRLVSGLGVLLLLCSVWTSSPYSSSTPPTTSPTSSSETLPTTPTSPPPLFSQACASHLLHVLQTDSALGRLSLTLAGAVPSYVVVPLCLSALYLLLLRVHAEERLLVLRGLGIQTSSTAPLSLFGGSTRTRFIPTDRVRDVLVNEAFLGFGVRVYLAVVVEGEDDVVVVFPRLLPRPPVVERVWRGVRECLYEQYPAVGEGGMGLGAGDGEEVGKGSCG